MALPVTLNATTMDDDQPDGITPRPLDDLFRGTEMLPPPMIQLAPLILNSIWDSDMVNKFIDDVTERKKWQCGHCTRYQFEQNATKVLDHVVGIVKNVSVCRATVPPHYKEAYLNLYRNKYANKALK